TRKARQLAGCASGAPSVRSSTPSSAPNRLRCMIVANRSRCGSRIAPSATASVETDHHSFESTISASTNTTAQLLPAATKAASRQTRRENGPRSKGACRDGPAPPAEPAAAAPERTPVAAVMIATKSWLEAYATPAHPTMRRGSVAEVGLAIPPTRYRALLTETRAPSRLEGTQVRAGKGNPAPCQSHSSNSPRAGSPVARAATTLRTAAPAPE